MISRRGFLAGSVTLLAAPIAAGAQQAGKVYRIGYLSATTAGADKTWVSAFQQGLRDLGYVEGENVVIEQRHAAGQLERLSDKTAKALGLTIPPSLLLRADQVIE